MLEAENAVLVRTAQRGTLQQGERTRVHAHEGKEVERAFGS